MSLNNPVKYIDDTGAQVITIGISSPITLPPVLGTSSPAWIRVNWNIGGRFHWHHLIPRQWRNHPVVQAARKAKFPFNKKGGENMKYLEAFSKETGTGRHGWHPRWNEYVWDKLQRWANDHPGFTPEQAARFCKNLAQKLSHKIDSNPNTKINDIFSAPPIDALQTPTIDPEKYFGPKKKKYNYDTRQLINSLQGFTQSEPLRYMSSPPESNEEPPGENPQPTPPEPDPEPVVTSEAGY